MKVKNMTAGTLVRTVTLVVALLNLVLTSFGKTRCRSQMNRSIPVCPL